jgi:hypothetical protein
VLPTGDLTDAADALPTGDLTDVLPTGDLTKAADVLPVRSQQQAAAGRTRQAASAKEADLLPVGGVTKATESLPVGDVTKVTESLPVGGVTKVTESLPVGGLGEATSALPIGRVEQVIGDVRGTAGTLPVNPLQATDVAGKASEATQALPVGGLDQAARSLPVGDLGLRSAEQPAGVVGINPGSLFALLLGGMLAVGAVLFAATRRLGFTRIGFIGTPSRGLSRRVSRRARR